MKFKEIEICCPKCKSALHQEGTKQKAFRCRKCDTNYPLIFGIPDLRIFPDPYIGIEADREKGLRVAERFDDFDFPELIDFYYSTTDVVPPKHAQQFKRSVLAAQARSEANLTVWQNDIELNGRLQQITLLEIGCGTAPLLVAAAPRFGKILGIDISFRWLVVAKKRLAEAALDVPLICCCAEALPFPDTVFDCIAAESVIETVRDQKRVLKECNRVMKTAGHLLMTTPNRFSLGPDPHTGIWAGSYFPQRLTAALVQKQGGIPPKRRLLSKNSVKRMIRESGFELLKLKLPDIDPEQRRQFPFFIKAAIFVYDFAKRIPLISGLLFLVGPMFHAIAQKPESKHHPEIAGVHFP